MTPNNVCAEQFGGNEHCFCGNTSGNVRPSPDAKGGEAYMNAPAKPGTLDPLLHPADVAKLLKVRLSWLAKSRLSGTGPRFVKIGRAVRYAESAVRDFVKSRQRNSTSED
jgi:predicted DNA-binding transcriptional regulator AlpA